MKITGELLKSERINKNLTPQDVAHALKLSPRIVQAIENGQIEELPAKTFIRGFVKSYADYLKIDTESVLKQFQEEMGSTLPVTKTSTFAPSDQISSTAQSSNKRSKIDFGGQAESISGKKYEGGLTKNHITTFTVVLSLVIAIVTINKIISHYEKELLPSVAKEKTPVKAEPVIDNSIANSVQAAQESVPVQASATTVLAVSGSTNSQTMIHSNAPDNKNIATTKETEKVEPEKIDRQTITKPPLEKSKGTPVEMLLEARKDTIVEYTKGNTSDFKKIILKANTYQILKSSSGLHIRAEDGSAINITINGQNKGLLSPTNKSVEITY